MRRTPSLLLGLASVAFVGGVTLDAAQAQDAPTPPGEARGLRYLSWSGRTTPPTPAVQPPAAVAATEVRNDLRRPNRVIPHGGAATAQIAPIRAILTPPAAADRRTLTPANAWMRSASTAPQPMAPLPPPPARVSAPPPASVPAPPPRTLPDYLPEQGGRGQPVPADIANNPVAPAPAPAMDAPADPMAPRRDAPIFRMQQAAPSPVAAAAPQAQPSPDQTAADRAEASASPRVALVTANPEDRPVPQGARYYSVHRQNGQTPDPLIIPPPTYIDALAVTMAETPASQDLAHPEAAPTLIRDAQGRVRAQPAAPEGDYQ